jgi:hypothetical protein
MTFDHTPRQPIRQPLQTPPKSHALRRILIGVLLLVVCAGGALWAFAQFAPASFVTNGRPQLVAVPPLPPATGHSMISVPVAITLTAIRDAIEARAPRNLAGQLENPLAKTVGRSSLDVTVARGPIAVSGTPGGLSVSAPLNGTMRATGEMPEQTSQLNDTISNLFGAKAGRVVQDLAKKVLDQTTNVSGNVTMTARPAILPAWRIEPNLVADVSLANGGLNVAGVKVDVGKQVKPFIDRAVSEQMSVVQAQIRNDPTLEQNARSEWAKLCRSIPLPASAGGANLPNLWLEVRPVRALAAQPVVSAAAITLALSVEAETRVVPTETKPTCPFPAQLEIVPPMSEGRVALALPIDLPFTELNKLLEAQLKGKTFPQDGGSAAQVTVNSVSIVPSGDRLLISLKVKARETASWFGLGTDATVYIWGRPTLDTAQQILRLSDISVDVESEAAFGLLGRAARAALPYIQSELQDKAVLDLKPFAADARKSVEAAIAGFQRNTEGVKADAAVTGIRLAGIAFDAKTLRVTAETEGTVNVTVTKLVP